MVKQIKIYERTIDIDRISRVYTGEDTSLNDIIQNMDTSTSFYQVCDELNIPYKKIGSGNWSKVLTGEEGEFVVKITDNTHGWDDSFFDYANLASKHEENHLFPRIHFSKIFKDNTGLFVLDNLNFSLSEKLFSFIAGIKGEMGVFTFNKLLDNWLEDPSIENTNNIKQKFFFSGAIKSEKLIEDWLNATSVIVLNNKYHYDFKPENIALNSQRKLVITDPFK